MKRRNALAMFLGALLMFALTGGPALAQDKDELQQRAAERYPQVLEAKRAGNIGETSEGLVEAVEGKELEAELRKLVDEENRDRRALYQIIARETNTDQSLVARRAAARNFDKARAGEWLKRGGKWEQKR